VRAGGVQQWRFEWNGDRGGADIDDLQTSAPLERGDAG
jgi:hypothetical protein